MTAAGRSRGPTASGRATNASTTASTSPSSQRLLSPSAARFDRQAERDENDDLGEARQRRMEALDPALGGNVGVADQDPGDVDREKAGAVRDGGDAVDDAANASVRSG